MKARFFRERRLLLALSLILLAHQLLGITVGKAADAVGLHFEVDKPERLFIAVWVMWTWTFICYAQQLSTLKLVALFPRSRYDEFLQARVNRIAVRRVHVEALARYREEIPRRLRRGLSVVAGGRMGIAPSGEKAREYLNVEVSRDWRNPPSPTPPLVVSPLAQKGSSRTAGWGAGRHGDSKRGDDCSATDTVHVPIDELPTNSWVKIAATLRTCISTSFVTDFIAPIVVGLAPLVVVISQNVVAYLVKHCGAVSVLYCWWPK